MIYLGLIRMTTLAQGVTNSVAQFVRILLKILVLHSFDQAKRFLNDVGVKKPKTKYNNKELALGIK